MQHKKLISTLIFISILIFLASFSSAVTQVTKAANQFTSTTGSYATSTHCIAGQTCNWIANGEILVGIYDSNPSNWGGSVTWNFDLAGINLNSIDKAELKVSWPSFPGKGLHSTVNTGQGIVSINNNEVARPTTNYIKSGDYFAHDPYVYYLTFPFNGAYLSPSTNVKLETTSNTGWDVLELKLYLYESNKLVRIVNGKILFSNSEFMIKGMDYAPWIQGTGPEPGIHQLFPNENDDVTSRLTNSGKITVKDYNKNGKIEMSEVIQYDLESMKAIGVNTIRTYASGGWHDRNLNGKVDSGETSQGDLPDWVYDKILAYANANDMKVIIGYWVQDENLAGNPMVCDFTDLDIAKKSFGRVVSKYKNNNAVLAWGIGNEVQGSFNQGWFKWGVDTKEYLNKLNDYVRTLDGNHPIIYAKYVGENANFNNINADIISVNAYTHSAQDLINKGEFSIPAPAGKAYMLGEFGHNIADSDAQWNLAKQYAGGCFLELNNIWWKTGTAFGILTQYREKQTERYNKVQYLYTGGKVICNSNADCGTDTLTGSPYCSGKDILNNWTVNTCNNPGTLQSSCSQKTINKVKQTCSELCSNGACTSYPACTDSDNGINLNLKGIATTSIGNKWADSCTQGSASGIASCTGTDCGVNEMSCSAIVGGLRTPDGVYYKKYSCANGCLKGACLATPTCTDSDNGINLNLKGIATTSIGNKWADNCIKGSTSGVASCSGADCGVNEMSCNSISGGLKTADGVYYKKYSCAKGCQSGACK